MLNFNREFKPQQSSSHPVIEPVVLDAARANDDGSMFTLPDKLMLPLLHHQTMYSPVVNIPVDEYNKSCKES